MRIHIIVGSGCSFDTKSGITAHYSGHRPAKEQNKIKSFEHLGNTQVHRPLPINYMRIHIIVGSGCSFDTKLGITAHFSGHRPAKDQQKPAHHQSTGIIAHNRVTCLEKNIPINQRNCKVAIRNFTVCEQQ